MVWTVKYLEEVQEDLDNLGKAYARRALKVIDERIAKGEPDKSGQPLRGDLAGCRRIRTGDIRIVYRINNDLVEVLIIAVGPRRNEEVYKSAGKRLAD